MSLEQNPTVEPLTTEQLAILPTLVDGAQPDTYVVVPVAILERQVRLTAEAVSRRHRGQVRPGDFAFHLIRSLMHVGVLVDTAHTAPQAEEVAQ